jgi:hypothetical protein
MQISLNNHQEEISTEGLRCFGELMDRLKEKAAEAGDTVLSVKLNGEDITGKDQSDLIELPVTDIEELEVQTGDPKQLARSTLYSIADFLEQLLKELQNTAELFRMNHSQRSNDSFLRCIDGLQVFMHTMESCRRLLGISYELIFVPSNGEQERSVAECRRELFGTLDAMIEAQSDQDWVLMADMLEYELIPNLEEWRRIIPEILQSTAPRGGTEPQFEDREPAVTAP